MADHSTLGPRLGHFLPYLLRRRLQAVLWPADGGERAVVLLLLGLGLAYGAGLGFLLNHSESSDTANFLPKLLVGLNATWLVSALLVDFLPALRPITRAVPEHFPVSARLNVVTTFLLDFITLRRLLIVAMLLAALAVAPRHAEVPGFSLVLVLGATVFSFNVRLLVALRRWRHPLLLGHLASLALMLTWLTRPEVPYYQALGVGMALLPWGLGAAQLYWLGPYFSARYLPEEADTASTTSQALARLPVEWKVYARKTWLPLLMGQVLKVILLVITGLFLVKGGTLKVQSFLYLTLVPLFSFTYVNNNLFGFLKPLAANEMQRLGLTPRLLALYLRLVGPVVVFECLTTAVLLLVLFPPSFWPLLGLLPLGAAAFTSLGIWGSFYQAKSVLKMVDFANMRNNTSTLMSICALVLAAALYFLPWWWARIALAALVTASAIWPIRAVLRNDGPLRRRLWRGIGA